MPNVNTDNLVVIDESGFPLNMTKGYGRCPKDERLKMPAPLHGKNISAIGAVSKEEIIDIGLFEGSVDQICVEAFIKHSVLPKLKSGSILLIDNAPVHNIEKINKELLNPIGAVALPLPRYSPDLSPIEMCWSKLKSIVRGMNPRNMEELYNAFVYAANEIEPEDLIGWYEHCGWQ